MPAKKRRLPATSSKATRRSAMVPASRRSIVFQTTLSSAEPTQEYPLIHVPNEPSISLFILAYNEEKNIAEAITLAAEFLSQGVAGHQLIAIDDCSKDRTLEIARSMKKKYPDLTVIHHNRNRGYGSTQRTGFAAATGDLITYLPGDNQLRPDALEIMLDEMERTGADIIVGTRKGRKDHWHRGLLAWVYHLLLRTSFGIRVRDVDSIKIVRRRVLDTIRLGEHSEIVDVELIARAMRAGFKVGEVDVPCYPRVAGVATGNSIKVIMRRRRLLPLWFRIHLGG